MSCIQQRIRESEIEDYLKTVKLALNMWCFTALIYACMNEIPRKASGFARDFCFIKCLMNQNLLFFFSKMQE